MKNRHAPGPHECVNSVPDVPNCCCAGCNGNRSLSRASGGCGECGQPLSSNEEGLEARNILAAALDMIDGHHTTSLVDCAKRAVELLTLMFSPRVSSFSSGTLSFRSLDGARTFHTTVEPGTGRLKVALGDMPKDARQGRAYAPHELADPPKMDLVAFDRMFSILQEDAWTGRYGATPELVEEWRAYRKKWWPEPSPPGPCEKCLEIKRTGDAFGKCHTHADGSWSCGLDHTRDHAQVELSATFGAELAEAGHEIDRVREELRLEREKTSHLEERQQEHLRMIQSLSQSVPLESEVREALQQRGALLAEIGTLRSQLAEARASDAAHGDTRMREFVEYKARRNEQHEAYEKLDRRYGEMREARDTALEFAEQLIAGIVDAAEKCPPLLGAIVSTEEMDKAMRDHAEGVKGMRELVAQIRAVGSEP